MKIFGIPLFISYDIVNSFILENFSTLSLSDDIKFITFIIVNFGYIFCIYLFCKFCKFLIITFKNFFT